VTPYSSRRRTEWLAALVLGLALALGPSACGGGSDPKSTEDPTQAASVSQTPTPTPTSTPTPTEAPLSAFEDKPAVVALRAWAVAEATTVNARQRSMASLTGLTTARGLGLTKSFAADDIAHGYRLPGPHPFTPVAVQVHGALAKVSTCFLLRGWSLYPKTQKQVRKRAVVPAVFEMRKVAGTWKLDNYYSGTADCAGVDVREVRW
jgi:hypothetical protein